MAFAEFNQKLEIMRPPLGEYILGVWTEYPPALVVVQSSVQPVSPSQVQLLPEGRRIDARFTLYSTEPLKEQDEVKLFGAWYEILHVARWQNKIISHYMGIAVKKQQEGVT